MRIRKILGSFIFFIGLLNALNAQSNRQPIFDHSLNINQEDIGVRASLRLYTQNPETLRVLVVMAAFKEDSDDRTSGTGNFDISTSTRKIIDPPPHDRVYVQNHMTFVSNYFRKVSDGKLIIQPTVLDNVYHLTDSMRAYSPPRNNSVNFELGKLVTDTWELVDSLSPGYPYHQYNAFIIFHAGVGRDVDLVSLYGYDPTPFDIPSVYLSLSSLQKMFGVSYRGVPVSDSSFFIDNSIIIPETENRELQTIGGTALLQLGINGLLVASIGSHLGLPDLFNTKTGRSGIGRFGLMDGQSIFSWNGIFPPEPLPWEKYFLGWLKPLTMVSADSMYRLPAVSLANTIDSIYRIPISAREYFLVENRNRDANRDGATVTMVMNGETTIRTWVRDTIGFNAFNQDSLFGVVVDVDEFDWSLPGGVNIRTGEWFDGGILIWHIDENIIEMNYATNSINANPERRGVDLEEADGSQDIGQAYGFLSPGGGSEDGTQFDYWYAGNKAPVRILSNEFTPASHPSSSSNDLANSHVYIKEFSERKPRMTVRIQVGDEEVRPLAGFPKKVDGLFGKNSITFADNLGDGTPAILAPSFSMYGWKANGDAINGFLSDGLMARFEGFGDHGGIDGKPVVGDFDSDQQLDVAAIGKFRFINDPVPFPVIAAWSAHDVNNDSLADQLFLTVPQKFSEITTSPLLSDSLIALGTEGGIVYFLRRNGSLFGSAQFSQPDTSPIVGISLLQQQPSEVIAVSSGGSVEIFPVGFIPEIHPPYRKFGKPLVGAPSTATISSQIGKRIALVSTDGTVFLVDDQLKDVPGFPFLTGGEISNAPSFADIDADGQRDIILFSRNKIYAINAAGAILDNFPITVSTSKTILTSPIVADLDGNGTVDIIAVTQEGLVVAYDKTGNMVRGFPILAGINGGSTPAAFYMPSSCLSCVDIGLAVASDDGNVYAWKTGTLVTGPLPPPSMPWPQYMRDAQNTGLDETILAVTPKSKEFFPTSLTYNWPNPVGPEHGFKTHIRYYVGENATIHIKIFDLAGDMVDEFDGPGIGGLDNEVMWDVSGMQSGIYFAQIEATGTSGSGNAVIKIAVVK